MKKDWDKISEDYAERVCNGKFPITYTREQVVAHTGADFGLGVKTFRQHVLKVLNENYEAVKQGLVEEDKVRTAEDILKETYEDLILIFS